ncbi:hypothetical protein DY000_02040720 [Brassica cretica]|uniref:Uncharacterized protein n=1 Tax=Brassica cretica TaxID=69181 RepID=A0ABQ7BKP2_BRACR|nr:hypothetical protein DY000_02040720 [Brassica cretica]
MVNSFGLCSLAGVLPDAEESRRDRLKSSPGSYYLRIAPYKLFAEARERGYGPGGWVDEPLLGRSVQSGAKTFTHCSFAGHFWKCNREQPLLVLSDMIVRVACTVEHLYVGEGKIPRHLDRGDSFHEGSIGIGVRAVMEDSVADIFSGVSLSYSGSESLSYRLWTRGFSAPSRVAPATPDAGGGSVAPSLELGVFRFPIGRTWVLKRRFMLPVMLRALVLIPEDRILRLQLAELFGTLLQLFGLFVKFLLQTLDF